MALSEPGKGWGEGVPVRCGICFFILGLPRASVCPTTMFFKESPFLLSRSVPLWINTLQRLEARMWKASPQGPDYDEQGMKDGH